MKAAKQTKPRLESGETAREASEDRRTTAPTGMGGVVPNAGRVDPEPQGAAQARDGAEKALELAADIIVAGALRAVLGSLTKG